MVVSKSMMRSMRVSTVRAEPYHTVVKSFQDGKQKSYKKKQVPSAVREQVWLHYIGKTFDSKCTVDWCRNIITPFQYECGHNIPESKGGTSTLDNLRPICSNCNRSMKDTYTIDEWNKVFAPKKKSYFLQGCFGKTTTVDSHAHIKSSEKGRAESEK